MWSNQTVANYAEHGSIFFSGILAATNPCEVYIDWAIERNHPAGALFTMATSGAGGNVCLFINGSSVGTLNIAGKTKLIFGSPFSGVSMTDIVIPSDETDAGATSPRTQNYSFRGPAQIPQINTGSPWVLFLGAGSNHNDSIYHYSIQSFRGAL